MLDVATVELTVLEAMLDGEVGCTSTSPHTCSIDVVAKATPVCGYKPALWCQPRLGDYWRDIDRSTCLGCKSYCEVCWKVIAI